jgi:glycerol-3-phosphate dehydrogenase
MAGTVYDIAIIGGGINGCGIARDAAGRGFAVYLCEQNDLASGTSSASTKLIHGGLRYLEQYEFRLVREALREREILLNIAPHIVRPLRFVLPHREGLRPRWMLRLGLFLYDALGGRKRLPPSRAVDLRKSVVGRVLKPEFRNGFEYSDCWVEDARLVVLNALDAAERGASINPRTTCTGAERIGGLWRIDVRTASGKKRSIKARTLVNAGGPWAGEIVRAIEKRKAPIRLVKGSHIVVPKLFGHDRAYIFQNPDGRVEFAIPFERDFTLIGTTDQDFSGDPADVEASKKEIVYLCNAASDYFGRDVTPRDVVWTYSGVRPLYDDGSKKAQDATRDYVLALDVLPEEPPLLNIYGGKITTYRRLAEEALEKLSPFLGETRAWTAKTPLPGGDFKPGRRALIARELRMRFPFLAPADAHRLVSAYGTRAARVLGTAKKMKDLGASFGADLTEAEVEYLVEHEWAETAEDILWRRSKLGLHIKEKDKKALDAFMRKHGRGGNAHDRASSRH